jgi:glycosyltransferase involved in cell wall biosynthesis
LAHHPGVELVGEVSDVRPYLQDASVVVAPLRIARGIQNKVLEALAVGKPVIASRQAIEGLEVVAGQHLYQATTPDEWLNGISALFLDSAERRRLGATGRSFVLNRHRWDRCLQPFAEVLGLTPKTQCEPFDAPARSAVQGV